MRASSLRRGVALLAAAAALLTSTPFGSAIAATPRASLTQIENDVMCVACRESLAVAQSPEAFSERQYIATLIAQGETQRQIEANLVAQYGPAVLALPPAHGFNLLVYVIPPLVVAGGIATVLITLPRWRRRTRAAAAAEPAAGAPTLSAADAHRLEEDLARHA